MQPGNLEPCLVDAHVHLYSQFAPADIVEAASTNFEHLASQLDLPPQTPGLLLLSQTPGEHSPATLAASLANDWQHAIIDDLGTLRLRHQNRPDLYIVPGWQVVSAEGLETLALVTPQAPKAGIDVSDALQAVHDSDGLAVLPWGIGKWTGQRGQVIKRLIESGNAKGVFFGDISGRLNLLPRPALLAMAEGRDHKVLAGTDPLPLAGEAQKIGRFGFRAAFDPDQPSQSLKAWLRSAPQTPRTAGKTETLPRFLRLQLAMQINKRLK